MLARLRSWVTQKFAPKPGGLRTFLGATTNRLNFGDWAFASSRSAEADTKADLRKLRDRARDLRKNSPFGARYAQVLVENVLGPTGIRLQAKNQTVEGEFFTRANKAIEAAWEDAGRVRNWDVEKKLTRAEQLALAVGQWGDDGEILIRKYRGTRFGPYGFQCQVLDPDLLDETFNQERVGNQPRIVQGVEFDDFGAPVAYWLWTRHPQDSSSGFGRQRIRVPASDIIHAFIPMRAGQPRGIPHAAAIMSTLRMLDGYIEAELVAARVASAKVAAVEDADPQNPLVRSVSEPPKELPADAEPGSMIDLRGTGGKLSFWDPQHPTTGFPDFTKVLARYIGIGYGVAYGTLTGDVSDANYSSMKVGQQPERDHFKRLTQFVIDHVLDDMYREWLAMALLNGKIVGVAGFDADRWSRVAWQPRGFPSPDPLKDTTADLMRVAAGVETLTNIAARDGQDLEEIVEQRKAEIALLKAAGIESVFPGVKPAEEKADDDKEPTDTETEERPARSLRIANA